MILQNAILNLETGEIIKSAHRHDFVTTYFKDGEWVACDGGVDYLKRSGDLDSEGTKWLDISLYLTDSFIKIKKYLVWGTRGLFGEEPLKYVFIKDLTVTHLNAILLTQPNIKNTIWGKVIQATLKKKNVGPKDKIIKSTKKCKSLRRSHR